MTTGQADLGVCLQINHVAREVGDRQIISSPTDRRTDKEGIVLFCLPPPPLAELLPAEGCIASCAVPAVGESSCGGASRPVPLQVSCLRKGAAREPGFLAPVSWIYKLPVTSWGSFSPDKAQVAAETITFSHLCWLNALPILQGPFQLSVPRAGLRGPSWSPSPFRFMARANMEDLYRWASLTNLVNYPGPPPHQRAPWKYWWPLVWTQIMSSELLVSWGDDHSLVLIQHNLMLNLTVNFVYPGFWFWPQPHGSCTNKVHRGERSWGYFSWCLLLSVICTIVKNSYFSP